jgi:hypothetical protein
LIERKNQDEDENKIPSLFDRPIGEDSTGHEYRCDWFTTQSGLDGHRLHLWAVAAFVTLSDQNHVLCGW